MREWDSRTISEIGVPSLVLMERAAVAVSDAAADLAGEKKRILCICGTGNNGGDGAAAARILFLRGYQTTVMLVGSRDRLSPDMTVELNICEKLGIPVLTPGMAYERSLSGAPADNAVAGLVSVLRTYDVIIDAIFGTGLSRDVEDRTGIFAAIEAANLPVVSADIPSGISADTGQVMGCAVKADITVTMQALKCGHLFYPGAFYSGKVVTAEIGIVPQTDHCFAWALEDDDMALIPERDPSGNKGTFGKVLVIAGSKNMSGASYLTSLAALKTGCGMVMLLTTEDNRIIIQETLPEIMLKTYSDGEEAIAKLDEALNWADVIACGPGLGQSETAGLLVKELLKRTDKPLVLDADALNLISRFPECLKAHKGPVLITPHPGEMARLTGLRGSDITADLMGTALDFSRAYDVTCLLKDARTCIASPSGRLFVNLTGTSGMATAGSGDVLTGIAAGLIARGMPVSKAGPYAAFLHGRAGEDAARHVGPSGLTATSLIESLPCALGELPRD